MFVAEGDALWQLDWKSVAASTQSALQPLSANVLYNATFIMTTVTGFVKPQVTALNESTVDSVTATVLPVFWDVPLLTEVIDIEFCAWTM